MARKRLGYTGVCMVGLFHTAYVRILKKLAYVGTLGHQMVV